MKKGLIIGIIFVVLIVMLVIIFYPSKENIPSEVSCNTNSDCVKFENPCCRCSEGGTAYVVNKDYVEEVKSRISEGCSEITDYCPMQEVFQDRCDHSIKCWDGMCGFEDIDPRVSINILNS